MAEETSEEPFYKNKTIQAISAVILLVISGLSGYNYISEPPPNKEKTVETAVIPLTYSVEGRLIDLNNNAIGNTKVNVNLRSCYTDSEGNFSCVGVTVSKNDKIKFIVELPNKSPDFERDTSQYTIVGNKIMITQDLKITIPLAYSTETTDKKEDNNGNRTVYDNRKSYTLTFMKNNKNGQKSEVLKGFTFELLGKPLTTDKEGKVTIKTDKTVANFKSQKNYKSNNIELGQTELIVYLDSSN